MTDYGKILFEYILNLAIETDTLVEFHETIKSPADLKSYAMRTAKLAGKLEELEEFVENLTIAIELESKEESIKH